MTKKHFEAIAAQMKARVEECHGPSEIFLMISVCGDLAYTFASANPRFDRASFLKACGLDVLTSA